MDRERIEVLSKLPRDADRARRLVIDVFFHPAVLDHDTGMGLFEGGPSDLLDVPELHPENAERVRNMLSRASARAARRPAALARRPACHRGRAGAVHDPGYVRSIREACEAGGRVFAPSTLSPPTPGQPILAAAGTALAAADAVLAARAASPTRSCARPATTPARPPPTATASSTTPPWSPQRARDAGRERVAVIDWDVHHGNGTQACFYDRADVLTVSLHMRHGSWGPAHPETGSAAEVGVGAGAG